MGYTLFHSLERLPQNQYFFLSTAECVEGRDICVSDHFLWLNFKCSSVFVLVVMSHTLGGNAVCTVVLDVANSHRLKCELFPHLKQFGLC